MTFSYNDDLPRDFANVPMKLEAVLANSNVKCASQTLMPTKRKQPLFNVLENLEKPAEPLHWVDQQKYHTLA